MEWKNSEMTNVVLPFQVIEQVDEPRAEGNIKEVQSHFLMLTARETTCRMD